MIRKVAIKNPGCQFCKFYLEPFKFNRSQSPAACAKGARRIYEKGAGFALRRWKWIDCTDIQVKNGDRFCEDFEVNSIVNKLIQALIVLFHLGHVQTLTAMRTERWWNDDKHQLSRKRKKKKS